MQCRLLAFCGEALIEHSQNQNVVATLRILHHESAAKQSALQRAAAPAAAAPAAEQAQARQPAIHPMVACPPTAVPAPLTAAGSAASAWKGPGAGWVCPEAAGPAALLTMPASPSSSLVEPACEVGVSILDRCAQPCYNNANAKTCGCASWECGALMHLTFPYDPLKIYGRHEEEDVRGSMTISM
jgi:hypothetical protein